MRLVKLALLMVFVLCIAGTSACRRGPSKAALEEQKKAIDDDMKKAIELNKGAQPQPQ
jgi:hypothetical protein